MASIGFWSCEECAEAHERGRRCSHDGDGTPRSVFEILVNTTVTMSSMSSIFVFAQELLSNYDLAAVMGMLLLGLRVSPDKVANERFSLI